MKVKKSINRIVQEINEHPFIFRNEADIQTRLYYYLCDELDEWEPKHETKFGKLMTNLVHREYFGGKGQRIDLVVFDERDVMNIEKNSMEKTHSKQYVNVSDAIEIKAELGYYHDRTKKGIDIDLNKLKSLKDEGKAENLHFIYIIRWPTNEKKQKEVEQYVRVLRKKCDEKDIRFYTNNKNCFLEIYQ